jgi:hypothetical protein
MNKIATLLLSLTVVITFFSFNTATIVDSRQLINPVLGDKSFVSKFGHSPDATTNNELRIKTHLEYVENLLRQKDVSNLTRKEQKKRNHLLDLLHDYWTAGVFPRNYDYADQRKPCFIDKNGTICAVGYLVEQTAGRHVAEQINSRHKYETIYDMNDKAVDIWIATSGLTKEECAMIQPTYGTTPVYTYNYISSANGIASSLFGGLNLSLNTINGIQIAKGTNNKAAPIIGLISGGGQIIFGAVTLPQELQTWGGINYRNESLKTLCFINIGLGLSTMILSTWNLVANRKPKNKPAAFNLYGFPTKDNGVGLAFSLTHTFQH